VSGKSGAKLKFTGTEYFAFGYSGQTMEIGAERQLYNACGAQWLGFLAGSILINKSVFGIFDFRFELMPIYDEILLFWF